MTNVPMSCLPGVCKVNSAYADSAQQAYVSGRSAVGRFTDMDGARFVAGYPEKIGGTALAYTGVLTGVPRRMRDWRDNLGNVYLAAGTNEKLYAYLGAARTDITPLRAITTGTITDKISTTNGSATVNVNHVAHGQKTDDFVTLTAAAAVGGLTIAGVYYITVVDADNYTFEALSAATSTAGPGGGATAFIYYRKELTNPFATVNGSSIVTVTHTTNGTSAGDNVTFSDATAVGGLTIDGEYKILSSATNSYTIDAGSAASSTASGGGTVSALYDIPIGGVDSVGLYGYGIGPYGSGGYGTAAEVAASLPARTWCLHKYGQQLFASPYGGTIYVWDPTIGGRAAPLYGAPATCLGFFITPERFVIALGINGMPMQIAWPSQANPTDWVSLPTNTANSGRTLQEGAYLIAGLPVRDGVNIIWSNTTAYTHDYSSDINIYDTNITGRKCGLVGPNAACEVGEVAYWMGNSEFWKWDGATTALPSDDIRDFVFRDINLTQAVKFTSGSNVGKKEVWFQYCSANSTEIDRYVIFHIDQACWSCGTVLPFTAMIDRELFSYPMAADASGFIYNLESGVDKAGAALDSYVEFSPMDVSKGDRSMDVFAFIPNFKRIAGTINLTVLASDYPQDIESGDVDEDGPFPILSSTKIVDDIRSSGKYVGYRLESNEIGGDWRLGLPLITVQPAGARQ